VERLLVSPQSDTLTPFNLAGPLRSTKGRAATLIFSPGRSAMMAKVSKTVYQAVEEVFRLALGMA
jgi:hypothetical protein